MRPNLTLRRTYTDHPDPADNDKFWSVDCEGYHVAALNLHQGRSDEGADWTWSIILQAGRYGNGMGQVTPLSGRAPTRNAALPDIRKAIELCLEYIGPEGWTHHVGQMEWLKERKAATRCCENRE